MNMYTTFERDIKISEDGKTIYIRHAYDKDKFHKLEKVYNKAWRFVPAESWMREYLTYEEDNETIMLLDTDGLGSPIYIGEQIGNIMVGAIISTDAFNIVGEPEIVIIEKLSDDNETLVDELKEKLRNGEAKFTYKKKNGEERTARGTLNKEIYGEANEPKGTAKSMPENQIRYFDLDSNGWRSFIAENLVSVE